MYCRGIRGATTADENSSREILQRTRELLALMIRANHLEPDDIASATFTTTIDLDAEFPALAARQLGWGNVALMCGHEMHVPGSLTRCIRVLIHWNTEQSADEIVHVFIRGAKSLRPDISQLPPVDWNDLNHWIDEHIDLAIQSKR
ncbi:MAG: chorismate mutase [Thermoguttaceae bacterium]